MFWLRNKIFRRINAISIRDKETKNKIGCAGRSFCPKRHAARKR